jgi:uncharacterized protein (TIGR01777 family)
MTDAAPSRVVIAGGTGFLGQSLARHLLAGGREVTIIGRREPARYDGSFVRWDGRTLDGSWAAALDGAAAIVNLAGRTVDCIKTPEHCDEILRSRVESTLVLGRALTTVDRPPPVWVQMGTAHIYGDPPEVVCDETSPFGYGLAPTVGRAWEEAFERARPAGTRGVVLRTGFVLGRGGGALARLGMLTRLGLGGRVGSGTQGMSWIHERDMNRIFERAITDAAIQGPYIATAPHPVSQAEFARELRRAMRVPIGLPAFGWMVRLGAPLVLRTDPELALYGRYCVPKRLMDEGFAFEFPALRPALADLFSPQSTAQHATA